jgi:hypothetical protein
MSERLSVIGGEDAKYSTRPAAGVKKLKKSLTSAVE